VTSGRRWAAVLLALLGWAPGARGAALEPARALRLPIPAVVQATPLWCWAAVSEMVLRYHRLPAAHPAGDYQCGIVAGLGGACRDDCRRCVFGAGRLERIVGVLAGYPQRVAEHGASSLPGLRARALRRPLTLDELRAELDAGRPVIAAITPGARRDGQLPAHVALIVGYQLDESGARLAVNDPFPYRGEAAGEAPHPYLARGAELLGPAQYLIEFGAFREGLAWAESVVAIAPALDAPSVAASEESALGGAMEPAGG
jgi:hypothetical protein